MSRQSRLTRKQHYWLGSFSAMASDCEVLIETDSETEARHLLTIAANEAWRIEQKFSRYRDDNIIYQINNSHGNPIEVDDETAQLLDFAEQLYQLSKGYFDITSGVLREAWHFDGSSNIPDKETINKILPRVGWEKVRWQSPLLQLKKDMQIDLGGIGKEYAVDRSALLIKAETEVSCLINYGGDLAITAPKKDNTAWQVGIESLQSHQSTEVLQLKQGGLATSGDTKRFLLKNNKRYSHVLNPKTGWPMENVPHSMTVVAENCTVAGMLATLSMLKGKKAEKFLDKEGVRYWCKR